MLWKYFKNMFFGIFRTFYILVFQQSEDLSSEVQKEE